ncbi:MAG: MazG family protein [Chloroflexi bacterium]|nr:MazG family protein [Chloroflexota bacterium]MCY3697807.1 MazG family protein [Chloroflexota bacterium]
MSVSLSQIIEAAGLEHEATLTVARATADEPPITTGRLVVLIDDRLKLTDALHHYPSDHPLRVIDTTFRLQEATVSDVPDELAPDAVALVLEPILLFDVRQAPDGVRGVMDRLRDPVDGCPWDNAQTHESLRPHLLEETYEVLEAIAAGDPAELCEELGDLMMQVVLHAKLAEQAGEFTLDDVSEGIRAKLVRRHPHVFGDGTADTPKLVEGAWERLKARERPHRESVIDGVPRTLPALARAQSILGRAERNGFGRDAALSASFGERLLDLVQEARELDVSAEDALRDALGAFERGVRAQEQEQRARPA